LNGDDPNWPRASAWLESASENPQLIVAGLPLNKSITPGRCDLAPAAIRKPLSRFSTYDLENGIDVSQLAVRDAGDSESIRITSTPTVLLGGDNSVTYTAIKSLGVALDRCGLITFDAHHDLRDLDADLTNGNPIRALLRDGLPGAHIVQIGIQSFANSPAYAQIAREQQIYVVSSETVHLRGIETPLVAALESLSRLDAIYVDLDVDVLDRAFAPACPGARPGGLQPWMLRRAARICGAHPKVRAIDIVEIDPTNDIADVTCLAAASFLLAFASGVATRNQS
jgi:formiminoglutamase